MLIVAWIFLIVFGLIGLSQLRKFFWGGSLNVPSVIVMFISIILAALSAGVIWGGLLDGTL